jgi:hypothetical protein
VPRSAPGAGAPGGSLKERCTAAGPELGPAVPGVPGLHARRPPEPTRSEFPKVQSVPGCRLSALRATHEDATARSERRRAKPPATPRTASVSEGSGAEAFLRSLSSRPGHCKRLRPGAFLPPPRSTTASSAESPGRPIPFEPFIPTPRPAGGRWPRFPPHVTACNDEGLPQCPLRNPSPPPPPTSASSNGPPRERTPKVPRGCPGPHLERGRRGLRSRSDAPRPGLSSGRRSLTLRVCMRGDHRSRLDPNSRRCRACPDADAWKCRMT